MNNITLEKYDRDCTCIRLNNNRRFNWYPSHHAKHSKDYHIGVRNNGSIGVMTTLIIVLQSSGSLRSVSCLPFLVSWRDEDMFLTFSPYTVCYLRSCHVFLCMTSSGVNDSPL